jgi:Protein of unknown function (DUF2281)
MKMGSIEAKIKELPKDLQKEAEDFIDFLVEKSKKKKRKKLRLDWVGGLKELKDEYSSVALQHKIAELRIQDELNRH